MSALKLAEKAWYGPGQRYAAGSLLVFLHKTGAVKNYGVTGPGPGNYSVVSSFRIKKKTRNEKHFMER